MDKRYSEEEKDTREELKKEIKREIKNKVKEIFNIDESEDDSFCFHLVTHYR